MTKIIAAVLAASALIAISTVPSEARRHPGPVVTEFCGDRYCPVVETASAPRRLRSGARARYRAARSRPAHHAKAAPARQAAKAIPLPLPRPVEALVAAIEVPAAAVEKVAEKAGNILEAFREHVAKIVEPVRPGFVAVKTESGRRAVVAATHAWRFAGFLRDLEATGYRIKDIGGYAYRRIAGTRWMSKHAFGWAIDVNQLSRNRVSVSMPSGVSRMAARWGLKSGGDWRNPDLGHFEVASVRTVRAGGGRVRTAHRHHRIRYAAAR